jgi:DNA-binding response OmpR family regulator
MNDVLLVYPERDMQLVSLLSKAGFYIQLADSSEEAINAMYRHQPDAVIMSDDLAPLGGQQLYRRLRGEFNVAIITLGSKNICERVETVEDGSDLYLDESVSDAELIARIHSLVRRYYRQSGSTTDFNTHGRGMPLTGERR